MWSASAPTAASAATVARVHDPDDGWPDCAESANDLRNRVAFAVRRLLDGVPGPLESGSGYTVL